MHGAARSADWKKYSPDCGCAVDIKASSDEYDVCSCGSNSFGAGFDLLLDPGAVTGVPKDGCTDPRVGEDCMNSHQTAVVRVVDEQMWQHFGIRGDLE